MKNKELPFTGFDRVVIDFEGSAVSVSRAYEKGIEPVVGFRRSDGWSLGAPKNLESVAQRMWPNDWTHKIKKGVS